MTLYPVSDKKNRQLDEKMRALGLREADFEESFVRSSGAGGQNVNKVSSCVILRHRPTGLSVKCQRERSQALNRFLAKRQLVDMIAARIYGEHARKKHEAEKIRRQKRRRSRRSKLKMLESKRHQGEKKSMRARISPHED